LCLHLLDSVLVGLRRGASRIIYLRGWCHHFR
jgi:hypothetical protein